MSVGEYDRDEAVEAVKAQRRRTLDLLEPLVEAQWEQIATPGWRVREVAGHLVASDEGALTGKLFAVGLKARPVEEIEAWNEKHVRKWSSRPVPALLHALDVWGRRVARAIAASPPRVRVPGPFGRVSMPWLGMLRVYDEWIHGEDVRRALGFDPDDGADVVSPVVRHMFALIPVQTLPSLPPSAQGAVVLRVSDHDLPPFGVDMGSHTFGEHVESDTVVSAPAAALVMIASGRDPWRDAVAAGSLTIEGPQEPAEVLLDALIAV